VAEQQIRFDDGASYERMMGVWSRLAGDTFLDWLAPRSDLTWVDVGCGNGAFTELLVERCAPAKVHGVDPSEGQLDFARKRPAARVAEFRQGDAMALPFGDRMFDVATMALVIFFVPDPVKGVAEMKRVVRPGGLVAAYAWDLPGGGFPMEVMHTEITAMGVKVPRPPSADVSRIDAVSALWKDAGLADVQTREITVQRAFANFDDLWTTFRLSPSATAATKSMSAADVEQLRLRVKARLPADSSGRITPSGRANAVKGRVPG
jgi:ubiquinone/menaquinone biosynthesis C-methylase UbiE